MPVRTQTSRPLRSRALATVAIAALVVVGLAACGDDDDPVSAGSGDGTTATTAAAGADGSGDGGGQTAADTVEAIDFELTSLTVAPGAVVTFRNKGEKPHTMTADDAAFDSGSIEPGATTLVKAPSEPGAYPFHCEIHPDMKATLTVEG